VTEKLREYGLLNDQKFAESFATARMESRRHGANRVVRDLRAHRIPASMASEVVQKVYAEVDEAELIREHLRRKFRSKDLKQFLSEPKNLAATYRKLRLAGFSANGSIGILREYARRAEELEDTEEVGEN
jgi:SOS response regulatory protein OraA/RecX